MLSLRALCCAVLLAVVAAPAFAQTPGGDTARADALNLYLDCNGPCDERFLREEINFVNFVRDQADSDIHLLITVQHTGSGGWQYTLQFLGRNAYDGVEFESTYSSGGTDTQDERREGLAQAIRLGLIPYVARTPLGERIQISYTPPTAGSQEEADADVAVDPWNSWVFRLNAGGNFNGESTSRRYNFRGGFSADRVTDEWKLSFDGNANYREQQIDVTLYTRDDEGKIISSRDTTFVSDNTNASFDALAVKSLGPHWSIGATGGAFTNSFQNYDVNASIAPAIEYSFFPYSESTRRELYAFYEARFIYADYADPTIFGETEEFLVQERLSLSLDLTQTWGNANVTLSGSHYFHDFGKYNVSLSSFSDIRLFRGLSFNVGGSISRIRDQISLPASDITDEEALLQDRARATSFSYFVNVGLSYRFGSIYNNVVNPRFGGRRGGGRMFFFF